jgi:hypothetical protein
MGLEGGSFHPLDILELNFKMQPVRLLGGQGLAFLASCKPQGPGAEAWP